MFKPGIYFTHLAAPMINQGLVKKTARAKLRVEKLQDYGAGGVIYQKKRTSRPENDGKKQTHKIKHHKTSEIMCVPKSLDISESLTQIRDLVR
jgi:hypothetical protein